MTNITLITLNSLKIVTVLLTSNMLYTIVTKKG